MSTLLETLELCKQVNATYKPALSNSPVASCTRSFQLLPLRFAAVGGEAAQRSRLPTLTAPLTPYPDVQPLSHSSYALRPLREGFLYLLLKRYGDPAYHWHSQYRVLANGSLRAISADAPWEVLPSATLDDLIKSFGWTITLYDLDSMQELRPLYSPTPLTPRMLDNYRLIEDGYRDSLPSIDVETLVQPVELPSPPSVLKYDQLECIADFKAQQDPQLRALLKQQPFNQDQLLSLQATRQAFAPSPNRNNPRGAAMVVDDIIGITQELNAWRNAAVDQVRSDWLQRSVEPGVDNERRLLVAQSFLKIEKLYPEMRAEQIVKREVMAETLRLQPVMPAEYHGFTEQARKDADAHDAQLKPLLEKFERDTRARVNARQQAGEFNRQFDEKYGPLVDRAAMRLQIEHFHKVTQSAKHAAEARALDHLRWVINERFLQALDRYDDADPTDGLAFAEQTGQCVVGMELSELGTKVLDHWWRSDPTERDNLAMRSIAFNQQTLREELAQLRDAAKAASGSETSFDLPEALARQAHAAANAFTRLNTLYEQRQAQNGRASVGLYAWYVALGRQVLRTAAPNNLDRALHQGLRVTLFASVHEAAVNVRLAQAAELNQTINPQRSAGQITRYLDQAWAEGLMQAHKSNFYKVRVSGVITLIEGMLMAFKARQLPDSDMRLKTELLAAAMSTAAAGFEIGVSYLEMVMTRYGAQSVTGGGATVALGRLKLWGAGLAGMGGLVLAWWDFADGIEHSKSIEPSNTSRSSSQILATAYLTRAFAVVGLSLAEMGTAIAIAQPLFQHLARTTSNTLLSSVASSFSALSARLGTQAARLILARLVLGTFWIGIAITVIIFIFDDDALEKWCKKSVYRRDRQKKPFDSTHELSELYKALNEVM
ncbi:T6SS effector BTH_I2691 family protein [Pseudomonas sp. L7]|uniref:T6SS effector BTH_I2691 family protein n=1 Tax=Pseudomonas sp. L7 TaxID=3388343 RepID=UPI003984BB83